jgi:hypothetical protein
MPSVYDFLLTNKIPIISARQEYKTKTIDSKKWKSCCFNDIFRAYSDAGQPSSPERRQFTKEKVPIMSGDRKVKICVVGDSVNEMDAARSLFSSFAEAAVSSIKFKHKPSPSYLLQEIRGLRKILSTLGQPDEELSWCGDQISLESQEELQKYVKCTSIL